MELKINNKLLGALRILFFFFLTLKYSQILYTSIYLDSELVIFSVSLLVIASLTSLLGFYSPYSILFILLFSSFIEKRIGTYSISNMIIVLNCLFFLTYNSWRFFSFDKLNSKFNFKPTALTLKLVPAISIIAYGVSSLGAIIYHFNDSTWVSGLTFKSILLNPYLTDYSVFFNTFHNSTLNVTSYLAFFGQSIFQFLLVPLYFINNKTKKIVEIWGYSFFIGSLFFINLSFLPHFEIILWLLIFNLNSRKKEIYIFYDEFCNLCKRSMFLIKTLDITSKIKFIPSSKSKEYQLNDNQRLDLKTYIYSQHRDKLYKGFETYYLLCKSLPLLYPLLPLFFVLKATNLGYIIYDFISKNRIKYFGSCQISYTDNLKKYLNEENSVNRNKSFKILLTFYFILIFLNLTIKITHDNFGLLKSKEKYSPINIFTYGIESLGFDIPNVFNSTDLLMGKYYFNIYHNGKLISLINERGERINKGGNFLFLSNHNSDRLYFGNSLVLKRYLINHRTENFLENDFILKKISERLFIYKKSISEIHPQTFKIILRENNVDKIGRGEFYIKDHIIRTEFITL